MCTSFHLRILAKAILTVSLCVHTVYGQKLPQQVIILHTNDMHAKIDNMAKLAYLKDSLMKSNPLIFLVAAGDNFTGNPIVDMVADKGYPMIHLMNLAGFDLSALGNHEFDLGQEFLNKRMAQADFPFICANVKVTSGILKQPMASEVLSKGDSIELPVISVIQRNTNGYPDSHPLNLQGLQFTDGIQEAKLYAVYKQAFGNLIALTHLGIDDDLRLADSLPELDLIIGGHSHTTLDKPETRNGVMIVQAGSYLRMVGKTTLLMHQGKILNKTDEIIPMSQLTHERKDIREWIDYYNDNEELNQIIATAVEAVTGYSQLGSLMTDALRDQVGADIAVVNRGGIRIDSLDKGPVRLRDVFRLDPFGNKVVLCEMTPDEIKSLIASAYNMNKRLDLEVSGLKYTVITDPNGKCAKVDLVMDSRDSRESREYLVAMSTYLATTYSFNHANDFTTRDITTAQTLIDYLQKVKTINYQGVERSFTTKMR
jgi:5'-nucleotidase/UDP-sugar diphosphatase